MNGLLDATGYEKRQSKTKEGRRMGVIIAELAG